MSFDWQTVSHTGTTRVFAATDQTISINFQFACLVHCVQWSVKGKEEYLYSAFLHQGTHKALRHGSHSFTCKQHHACLSFMSIHQMAPPQQLRQQTPNCSLLLIYRPQKDERLSWPSWLTCSGWFTHISGHPSATGRAQDSESTPAKDRCSTTGPRNQRKVLLPTCRC